MRGVLHQYWCDRIRIEVDGVDLISVIIDVPAAVDDKAVASIVHRRAAPGRLDCRAAATSLDVAVTRTNVRETGIRNLVPAKCARDTRRAGGAGAQRRRCSAGRLR